MLNQVAKRLRNRYFLDFSTLRVYTYFVNECGPECGSEPGVFPGSFSLEVEIFKMLYQLDLLLSSELDSHA